MKPRRARIPERLEQEVSSDTRAEGTQPKATTAARAARDTFWTVSELAQYLQISQRWVHERTRRNEIPCHRLGTAIRFDPHEIQVWMIRRREIAAGPREIA